MALYHEDIVNIELNSRTIHRSFMSHAIGEGDTMANRFGVRMFRNGRELSIGEGQCQGFFMAPDGTNLLISGSNYTNVEGNVAWVQLPQECYAKEGTFSLAIKLIGGGVTGTMRIVDGMVSKTGATGAEMPTSQVPTSAEIIAAYDAAIAAVDDVNDLKSIFDRSRIRDKSIITDLPFGNYSLSGSNTNGYNPSSSSNTFGMEEIKLATKPIVLFKKNPAFTGINCVVQTFEYEDSKYINNESLIGWFTAETNAKSVTILAGMYYWIAFRDGNNPHQLTKDEIAKHFEIFETEAEYGIGASHTTKSHTGSKAAAMSIKTQYAKEDMLVSCNDWDLCGATYVTYDSGDPYEIGTSYQYGTSRIGDFVIPEGTYYRLYITGYDLNRNPVNLTCFDDAIKLAEKIKITPTRISLQINGYLNNGIDITGLKSRISLLARRIDELERESGIHDVPSYYEDHIESKTATVNALRPENGDQFIFITDMHVGGYQSRGGNAMNSHALINYLCKNTTIKKVFNGGDLLNNDENYTIQRSVKRISDAINNAQPDTPMANQFFIVGNHDGGLDYDGQGGTTSPRHITPEMLSAISGVYSVADVVIYDNNSPFQYYYDNKEAGLRYIVLDIGERDNATDEGYLNSFDFFASALMSTPNGYEVIVFNHISGYDRVTGSIPQPYPQYIYDVLDAYNAKTSYSLTSSKTVNFANAFGEAICVICGHNHLDSDTTTTDGIHIVITTCDNVGGRHSSNGEYVGNLTGTTDEQAFDVVTIDKDERKIYFTRIGYGSDRVFTY